MTEKNEIQEFFQSVRAKSYDDTKNMTIDEKFNYFAEGAKLGQKRIKDAIVAKQKQKEIEIRNRQVLIRLTESERSQLKQETIEK
ncbi:MAG: hypothetical protein LBB88_10335 [Planctomycetaceae bacterium]|jgi:hypothetical protein|nr:hypothetical protein [Planctomycetaceae bacterium]